MIRDYYVPNNALEGYVAKRADPQRNVRLNERHAPD